jgi:cytochrome c553
VQHLAAEYQTFEKGFGSDGSEEIMSRTARFRDSLVFITAATTIGTAVLAWALTVKAEDAAKGQAMWEKGECSVCHGWSGDGIGTADQSAPSMRVRHLTRTKIREVIQCGRPGTNMPYF